MATPPLSPIEPPPTSVASPLSTATATPRPANLIVHLVQPGDTIMGLALQYNVPVDQIYQLNGIDTNSLLSIGQELIIGPSNVVTATATPWPTMTATPLPTIVPPISLASLSNQPVLAHDLLFIRDESLVRWNHLTGQQEVLTGPDSSTQTLSVQPVSHRATGPGPRTGAVLSYLTSADKQHIVVWRWNREKHGHELGVLDVEAGQVTVFYEGVAHGWELLALSVSPDGKYVAWIPQDMTPASSQSRVNGLAAPAHGGGVGAGPILIAELDNLGLQRNIGYCGSQQTPEYNWNCRGLLWSPDGQSIAWADGNGVWVTELAGTPQQLVQTALTMPGKQSQGVYTLQQWSPSGRYILLRVGHYEGSTVAILDVETGQIAPLPNSFEYTYPGPVATWTDADQLFVGRSGRASDNVLPALEIWRIDTAGGLTMTVTHSLALNVDPDNAPVGLVQHEDGQLALALVNRSNTNYADRGLYLTVPDLLVLRKVNGLPPLGRENDMVGGSFYNVNVYWTPDSGGVIVEDLDSRQLLYASTTDVVLYDLRPLLGDSANGFHWVE
jgi:LysM repeat protein